MVFGVARQSLVFLGFLDAGFRAALFQGVFGEKAVGEAGIEPASVIEDLSGAAARRRGA